MLQDYIKEETILEDAFCKDWEEVVDAGCNLLIRQGAIGEAYKHAIKAAVEEFGGYMVLIDDIAFFHGRPGNGVYRLAMSLVTLREPVYLKEKRIKAAFVFAALDNSSHMELLQEFGEALQDESFLKLLRENGGKDAILKKIKEGEDKR